RFSIAVRERAGGRHSPVIIVKGGEERGQLLQIKGQAVWLQRRCARLHYRWVSRQGSDQSQFVLVRQQAKLRFAWLGDRNTTRLGDSKEACCPCMCILHVVDRVLGRLLFLQL